MDSTGCGVVKQLVVEMDADISCCRSQLGLTICHNTNRAVFLVKRNVQDVYMRTNNPSVTGSIAGIVQPSYKHDPNIISIGLKGVM